MGQLNFLGPLKREYLDISTPGTDGEPRTWRLPNDLMNAGTMVQVFTILEIEEELGKLTTGREEAEARSIEELSRRAHRRRELMTLLEDETLATCLDLFCAVYPDTTEADLRLFSHAERTQILQYFFTLRSLALRAQQNATAQPSGAETETSQSEQKPTKNRATRRGATR